VDYVPTDATNNPNRRATRQMSGAQEESEKESTSDTDDESYTHHTESTDDDFEDE
jgi:hypothetical protein